ncbi:hypothetical protein DPMN_036958 [Dreissena polymorpha]|uniref:Uncharacterized protein n=1 Tax=Dreissena polymorpha TaxID=45954 RepID=A0A9D4RLX4_DREPO|nr:hypothetical protein DPMN_036958 [Dreissena polymorpha]
MDGTSTHEIQIRNAFATAAMTKLRRFLTSSSISFPTKYKLYKSRGVSILRYGYETWTLHRVKDHVTL